MHAYVYDDDDEIPYKRAILVLVSAHSSTIPSLPGEPPEWLYWESHGGLGQVAHKLHQPVGHGPAFVEAKVSFPPLALALGLLMLEVLVRQSRILLRAQNI